MKPAPRLLLAALGLCLCSLGTGCSSTSLVRVRPWERGLLADSLMDPNRDPLGAAIKDHVATSREAASGGRSVGGAGCGCN